MLYAKRLRGGLNVVIDIERLLLDSANGITRDIPESITNTYRSYIDKVCLSLHLQMLPDAVKQYNVSTLPIKKVSSVHTLCDVLNFGGIKQLLSQVHILLQLFFTIPRGHFLRFEG